MASSSSSFNSLQLQIPHTKPSSKPPSSKRLFILRPITASISHKQSTSINSPLALPIRDIPGNPGIPFIQPLLDRQDYFYNLGRTEYFKSKIQKYKSTVFRANVPPGPCISSNSNVIVLLDGKSFPTIFDLTKVDKKDVFTGTYMPSTELTGGYRMLSYLDVSEPSHAKLKSLIFSLLKSSRENVIPEFRKSYGNLFNTLESDIDTKGKASFPEANDQAAFNFLARAFFRTNPADTKLGLDGPKLVAKWVLFQLAPLLCLGLPKFLEEITIHSCRLPPGLVKKDYNRLYDFFYQASAPLLDQAAKSGISRDEACHNLLFTTCFNTFGGMKIFFPHLVKWLGQAGLKIHEKLAEEIRSVIKSNGGKVTMESMEKMPLMKSVVYETLRIEPPIPLQFGRAKRDFVIESHDSGFRVKKGELLFGFQPFATKDPKIFDRPEEFVPDRFMGEMGEKLLKHVLWSNGPESENPTVGNKQCAGKDFVVLISRLLVVELFLRYDSFEIEVGKSALGVAVTMTSLNKSTGC